MASLSKWQHYLLYAFHCVVFFTDHKALEYHKAPYKMNQRKACWNLKIFQFDLKIEYKPDKLNLLPDILSRDPNHVFDPQVLDNFNTGTMLLHHVFSWIDGNYCAFRNRALALQKSSSLGQRILLSETLGTLKK